jgi:hypothetical protein
MTLLLAAACAPAFLAMSPCPVRGAGDEDVFQYRAYPNMFVVLERGENMTVYDNVSVSDVDGNGVVNRYDLALKVLFRVLNADGSQIDGHSTPSGQGAVDTFRSLIDLDDEFFLSQRIGLMYFDNAIHSNSSVTSPGGAPFQVYAPGNPPNLPPYTSGTASWQYRALWDNVYAIGPPTSATTIPIPWNSVRDCFSTAASGDPDTCRPKVTVLIVTSDAFDTGGNWKTNVIDNTFNPFLLIVGSANRQDLRNLIVSTSNIPDGRIAFFSGDADIESSTIFANLVAQLQASTFEFVAPVVPAVRSTENNRLFVASFTPSTGSGNAQAFWPGHLISFDLNADGSIPNSISTNWDAATVLNSRTEARRIYTYDRDSSQRYEFNTVSTVPGSPPLVTRQMLGMTTDANRNIVVNTVRALGLGDIFHSTPVLVGPPSRFAGDPTGLAARQTFVETYSQRKRVIVTGANDGMLHAFNAGNWIDNATPGYNAGTGVEEWAYIPGFLAGKVSGFAPTPIGTPSIHNYYVDAPVTVTDIWVDSDTNNGNGKRASEWHTVAIGGAGRGGKGFFALDITDPASSNYPAVLWEKSSADSPYLGETWSVPVVGKIQRSEQVSGTTIFFDKWVALVGAGKAAVSGRAQTTAAIDLTTVPRFVSTLTVDQDVGLAPASGDLTLTYGNKSARGSYTSRSGNSFDNVTLTATGNANKIIYPANLSYVSWSATGTEGKAILVLDAFTGSILQTLTHADMGPVAASPTVLADLAGYIERGYVGDLQGNLWRVTVDNTGTFSLGGAPILSITGSGYSGRIYTKPAVAKGAGSYPFPWVYFGTGDRDAPMDTTSRGAVFGVFDSQAFTRRGTMTTTTISDATDLTNNDTLLSNPVDSSIHLTVGTGKKGWFAVLPSSGEKALTSPPAVFSGNLFFTTFQPLAGNCSVGGTARVYGFRVIGNDDGLGAFALYQLTSTSATPDTRMIAFTNVGIPSAPIVSVGIAGAANLYFGTTGSTVRSLKIPSPATTKTLKYWREVQ